MYVYVRIHRHFCSFTVSEKHKCINMYADLLNRYTYMYIYVYKSAYVHTYSGGSGEYREHSDASTHTL